MKDHHQLLASSTLAWAASAGMIWGGAFVGAVLGAALATLVLIGALIIWRV